MANQDKRIKIKKNKKFRCSNTVPYYVRVVFIIFFVFYCVDIYYSFAYCRFRFIYLLISILDADNNKKCCFVQKDISF